MKFITTLCKKNNLILLCIVIAALLLRIYNISNNPPGVHADEADSGYNAYSILKTGKDFYGNFLPIQIIGFAQNYRNALSTYITVPFVAVFGLSVFSIRFPAVLFGTIFVVAIFYLCKKLFTEKIALIAAALSAINPWAVHISRAYADHILSLDFFLGGLIVLLYARKELKKYIFAAIVLSLSFFSYHAPKIFIPLFMPIFLIYARALYKLNVRYIIIFSVVVAGFFMCVLGLSIFSKGAAELGVVSVINRDAARSIVDKERRVTTAPLRVSGFFHNKYLVYFKEISRNMGRMLSFNYLYLDGERNLTASVGDRGLFFPIELPFLLIGIFILFAKKTKLGILLVLWLLISVIPGAITRNEMYTYRNIFLLPVVLILTSVGLNYILFPKKKFISIIVAGGFVVSFMAYYFHYFYDYPVFSRGWWAAEQKDALSYVINNQSKYEHVYIQGGSDWPLLYAFYAKTDPKLFQDSVAKLLMQNSKKSSKIGKVEFSNFKILGGEKATNIFPKNSLIVVNGDVFKEENTLKTIRSEEDWGTVYRIIEVQ